MRKIAKRGVTKKVAMLATLVNSRHQPCPGLRSDLHTIYADSSHARIRTYSVSRLFAPIFDTRRSDESGDLTRLKPKFVCEKVNFWYADKQALFDVDLPILERS